MKKLTGTELRSNREIYVFTFLSCLRKSFSKTQKEQNLCWFLIIGTAKHTGHFKKAGCIQRHKVSGHPYHRKPNDLLNWVKQEIYQQMVQGSIFLRLYQHNKKNSKWYKDLNYYKKSRTRIRTKDQDQNHDQEVKMKITLNQDQEVKMQITLN